MTFSPIFIAEADTHRKPIPQRKNKSGNVFHFDHSCSLSSTISKSHCVSGLFSVSPEGSTAPDFIDSRTEGRSRLETLWDFLSAVLSVRTNSINIFSIADRGERTVDVHFYVLTDSGYMRPEKLHAALATHKKEV